MPQIQHRRATKSEWSSSNPILAAGEMGVEIGAESEHDRFKLGDGFSNWNSLDYFLTDSEGGLSKSKKLARARDGELLAWGHSYTFGIGASDLGRRYTSLLADMLRLRERSEAIAGTAVATESSGASWGAVLQKITRGSRGPVPGSGVPSSSARGFAPPGGVYVTQYGINDVQNLGNTKSLLAPVKESLRVILSRFRAGAIFEESDSTFSYTGAWPAPSDTTKNSGSGYRYSTVNGSSYTITTPADFPGGTLCVGYHAPSGVGKGATHNISIDGGTSIPYEFRNARSGAVQPHVLRLTDLAPGVHTIVGTISSVSEYTAVDYWSWEPPLNECPLVLLLGQPLLVDYSAYGASPVANDDGVNALNSILSELVAEFGERVLYIDLSSMNKNASYYMSDKLHPSDLGHLKIAQLCYARVNEAGFEIDAGATPSPRLEYATTPPSGTRTFYFVGDEVRNRTPIESGTAGSKYVVYGWLCTVEGRPGTWLPLRYLTGN